MATNNEVDIPDVDNAEEINKQVTETSDVDTPQEIEPEPTKSFYEYVISKIKNNAFVVILIVVLLAYIFLFSSLGNRNGYMQNQQSSYSGMGSIRGVMNSMSNSMGNRMGNSMGNQMGNSPNGSSGKYILELFLWAMFVILILLNGVLYIFNVDVVTSIKNILGNVPQVEVVVDTDGVKKTNIVIPKEVYHIPGNHYDYNSAKAICKARGSELASYSDISKAFKSGADWCGYGWSEGQMALFPTQMEKWEKLQKIEGHENDCGRPGINGGYIDNPDVRYGVNCYGIKSPITPDEALSMSQTSLYPKTQKELDFDKLVDYWKTKIPDILLAPFNHNNWSIL
jgi:hypothetical protein